MEEESDIINKSEVLVSLIYKICRGLPRGDDFMFKSHLSRTAIFISSNLAEGQKKGKEEFREYINTSIESLKELKAQLNMVKEKNYVQISAFDINKALDLCGELDKMIHELLLKLNA
ncbi:four helix bundle protein [Candidatus Woesearchaeota archaeon]|nr:four helix bundle protein [Candidatus Woesearchaeota archaeon]